MSTLTIRVFEYVTKNGTCDLYGKAITVFVHLLIFLGVLRQKDMEQAMILEEKMGLQLKLLASAGVESLPIEAPSYCHLVTEHQDSEKIRKEVMNAIQVIF